MALPTNDQLSAISSHAAAVGTVRADELDLPVVHCPGWNVADALAHLLDVHWFWATIVEGRLAGPPDENLRPARPERSRIVDAFRRGADHLVETLRATPDDDVVWTWAPGHHTVGFVSRHQVQEMVVHHWDIDHARGIETLIDPTIAADAVDEFLTVSVSSDADPAEPERPALDGTFLLRCSDVDAQWVVRDGNKPGTVAFERRENRHVGSLSAPASRLLLWLYSRVDIGPQDVDPEMLQRFRNLTFTS
jgi:uncharacterized protein (TIGR03083 family)